MKVTDNKYKFVTLYGWAFVEKDAIFLRSPYLPITRTAFAYIAYSLLWVVVFVLQFFGDASPRKYVGIVIWSVLLLLRLPDIYDALLKRSYSNRIPLKNIVSFTSEDDYNGLETEVKLILKNGRYRTITFRKMENQAEDFKAHIAQFIPTLNLA